MLALPLAAQTTVYRAQPETLWWRSSSTAYREAVRGADTLRERLEERAIARSRWSGRGDTLRLLIQVVDRGPGADRREDTLVLLASGRVLAINGRAPGSTASYLYNVLPRLPEPAQRLRPGFAWRDSVEFVHAPSRTSAREIMRTVLRARVSRAFDTLGTRVVEVVEEGTHLLRVAAAQQPGDSLVFDVTGPWRHRWYFDTRRGTFVGNVGSVELRGSMWRTAAPGEQMPALLRRQWVNHRIGAETGALMARALPAGDTLVELDTVENQRGVSVTARAGDSVAAGFVRDDGMVATAVASFGADGIVRTAELLWTDSAGAVTRLRIVHQGDSLRIGSDGPRQPVPTRPWGIADDDMDQLLVPLLRRLPSGANVHGVTLYRPRRGIWEHATATRTVQPDGAVWLLVAAGVSEQRILVIDDAGDLLGVIRTATGERLLGIVVPPLESARYARYERITDALSAGKP